MFLLLTITIACFITVKSLAQTNERTMAFNHVQDQPAFKQLINEVDPSPVSSGSDKSKAAKANMKEAKAALAMEAATSRSALSFKKTFPNVEASWAISGEGFFASFTRDGNRIRSDYDRKGHWVHTLTYLVGNENAPKEIKDCLGDNFPGSKANLCVRVEERNRVFYIVETEDRAKFRQVAMQDGEFKVLHEYQKAN